MSDTLSERMEALAARWKADNSHADWAFQRCAREMLALFDAATPSAPSPAPGLVEAARRARDTLAAIARKTMLGGKLGGELNAAIEDVDDALAAALSRTSARADAEPVARSHEELNRQRAADNRSAH